MSQENIVKALGLLSGGLDSRLAVCVLKDQGIDVHAVVFDSPFFNPKPAKTAAKDLGIHLYVVNFTENIVQLLKDPPHGFGSCMNPCIDCHAAMLNYAGKMMAEKGFDFLFTGEVLNQRPMSQNRDSLGVVARDSEYADFILRPLSAQLLPETKVEIAGLVDRSKLLSLHGRSRKPQFALAKQYGITDYPSPAGGCRLTEPNYSRRLAELKDHEGLDDARDFVKLRYGRHFRLSEGTKYILGRDREDNDILEKLALPGDYVLRVKDVAGPTGVLSSSATEQEIETAAEICVRYSQAAKDSPVSVMVESTAGERILEVQAAFDESISKIRI